MYKHSIYSERGTQTNLNVVKAYDGLLSPQVLQKRFDGQAVVPWIALHTLSLRDQDCRICVDRSKESVRKKGSIFVHVLQGAQ